MTGPRRRPREPGPARRRVEVRFTEAEHAAVRVAASRGPGRPLSLGRFVAEAALAAAGAPAPGRAHVRAPSRLALAEVMDAVAAVNRVGNNLNQLARERNITGLRPVGTRDAEQRALAALDRLAEVAERTVDGSA